MPSFETEKNSFYDYEYSGARAQNKQVSQNFRMSLSRESRRCGRRSCANEISLLFCYERL